jgi:hypothetical protein
MATGILVFEGMRIGVLPGDFTVEVDEHGSLDARLVLSTAYNVLPLWVRVANDELLSARSASEAIRVGWGHDDQKNRELLIAELEPSLQLFVACGIALDALYDQLRPFAKLTASDIQTWKDKKTARDAQIAEVARRVYRLDATVTSKFKQNIAEILKYRDLAVHPSLELKQTCTRPDIPVGVDWKFAAYRYSNAERCFRATMEVLIHLYERGCGVTQVDEEMARVFNALEELKVVKRNVAT